jgi:hypothetical protein
MGGHPNAGRVSIDERCLTMELELQDQFVQTQENVTIRYKQFQREEPAASQGTLSPAETARVSAARWLESSK